MSKSWLAGISALALVTVSTGVVLALDISAKKLSIKDSADTTKRAIQVQSIDLGVMRSDADSPNVNGATVHVYSSSDDFCLTLPADGNWTVMTDKVQYKNKVNKNSAQVKNGKLIVKIKSDDITYSLDEATQGHVNVQVQFGDGVRYCIRCNTPSKDTIGKFAAKACPATACDPEPSSCVPPIVTTTTSSTTSSSTSSTTSTTLQAPGTVLQGALTATTGLFNYNLTLGVPGSDAACNGFWAGSHTCTYAELQSAETAGDLMGRVDTGGNTVTSFWAIDALRPNNRQCFDTFGSMIPWAYQTAHTGVFADIVDLNNGTGTLGPLRSGSAQGALCLGSSWVGCCL
jgi:hypothetical protein